MATETGKGSGPVAVVTGAARGIGAAIAERLAEDGFRIVILDIDWPETQVRVAELASAGHAVTGIELDCTDIDAVEEVFVQVAADIGAPQVLVNNCGGGARELASDFVDCDVRSLEGILAKNLKATVYCSRQVVGAMRDARHGKIVNIASEAPFIGGAKCWDYSSAKAGIVGFTRSIAQELAPFGINVNAIGPGPTMTRALEQWGDVVREEARKNNPMGRTAETREMADVVAFLASDQASYITGQTVLVNGGRWML